jgi:acyl-CoA reductase-like NAD-dependent aldehyde dehydrogenase/GNAT superfamily N-acetyltransferase
MLRHCDIHDFDSIYSIVNDAAIAYKGVIPDDRWKEPYMSRDELKHEIDEGVLFWGYEADGEIVGVMGIQHIQDVTLIRHAYVRNANQKLGIGKKLISELRRQTDRPILIGTWADAVWAIRFYERQGFHRVSNREKERLLGKYWSIPKRQVETSVVLADRAWFNLYNEPEKRSVSAGSPYFAELTDSGKITPRSEVDRLLDTLYERKDKWVRLSIPERLSILGEIRKDLFKIKDRWVHAELEAKGIPARTFGEAEEWGILATVFRAVRILQRSLGEIQQRGRPGIAGSIRSRPNGQVVVPVFPRSIADRLLFLGVKGEVWMEPGVTAEEVLATQAWAYGDTDQRGKIAFVLGAGNASVLPVIDFLHKLFVELQIVVIKLNPVNAHMGPLMKEGFRALVHRGFLGFVYGGAEQGSYLCNHPAVDELHLTGSDKTYETIVFGSGSEGKKRKAERNPMISKRFTGELGNVSPVIVVPGPWQKSDIEEQAKHIATWLVANAGFACLSPRVIVQHESWSGRSRLIDQIGQILSRIPTRKAYYPGARDRHAEFLAAHPEALNFGKVDSGHLPWTLIPALDAKNANDICFKREAFCSLCAETALNAPNIASFIDRAVEFVNHTLWGTLNATLIVHPKSLRDPDTSAAIDRAIDNLRYGTISVNMLAYYATYVMTACWGAFPGHDIYDIQSGVGKTFNFLMFERPQKSVIRAPFKRIDPITVKSKQAPEFCRKLTQFEAYPSWWKLPGLAFTALTKT